MASLKPAPRRYPVDRPPSPTETITIPGPRLERGMVAVIIDDIGHNHSSARPFLEMDQPLALAVLPGRPAARELAVEAHAAGKTVMLHLPMEPDDPDADPGEGAIYRSQRRSEIIRTLESDLAQVPHAVGVNNHMGSLATTDRRVMKEVLEFLDERGLFFIDSRTTPKTVAYEVAQDQRIPTALRDVFLDNERSAEAIDAMVDILLDTAEEKGWALGIGHPYLETADALKRLSAEAKRRNIRWVTVEELLRQVPGT